MIFVIISLLVIFISCFVLNKNDNNFNNILTHLNYILVTENENYNKIYASSEKYLKKLRNQEDYLKFIKDINNNYYYPLNKKKNSLYFNLLPIPNLINKENCFSYHLIVSNSKNIYLICINNVYNLLSLYNLTIQEQFAKKIIKIPLSLSLDFSFDIHLSFSAFDEEQTKIYIFNNQLVYSILLNFNFILDNITIANIKNFTIPKSDLTTENNTNNSKSISKKVNDIEYDINENLIYLSTTLYHANRYIIYGYSTGEIKVYLIRDKSKDNYISVRTTFNLHKTINKIYQIQGYLFVVTDNKKKINVLSLLGSNNILINCYNFNEIIDLVFEYKKNLLYILDNKGNIIIKELVLSVSKAYTNTCNNIYYLQIPKYIIQRHNKLNKKLSLKMTKDLNTIFIIGFNYISYINNKFILENYLLYNQNSQFNKINSLEDYNNNIYIKGSMTFLLANYNKKILIYEIKNTNNEDIKNDNKEKNKSNNKETTIYNTIDDNSGIVECNGNVVCKMLFNSITNNKYTINTLYITCIIIIITTVYQCNKNKNEKKRGKTFKEDNFNFNNKNNTDKISEVLNQIKSMGKFENFADYKKRQRDNDQNNINTNSNKYFEDDNDEKFKDYYGDEDDDEDDKGNSEEFLEKTYHNYVSDMLKKEKKKFEDDNDDVSDDENNVNNYEKNNRNINRFEERKDQLSQEEDSEDGRLNTD